MVLNFHDLPSFFRGAGAEIELGAGKRKEIVFFAYTNTNTNTNTHTHTHTIEMGLDFHVLPSFFRGAGAEIELGAGKRKEIVFFALA